MRREFVVLLLAVFSIAQPVTLFAQRCNNTSVGFTPVNDLAAGFYRGWQGGLYPDGQNQMPAAHGIAGEELAAEIGPLNSIGQPDPVAGKIVLLSIGMSNSWQEFHAFKALTDAYEDLNPALVVVNGAQPGNDIDMIVNGTEEYWTNILDSLQASGVSGAQVQAIWFKQAEAYPMFDGNDTTFHGYVDELKAKFLMVMNILRTSFPNAKLCYMASRTYGGYADFMLNPEPFAYYTGWTVKRLIEDQINGEPGLSYAEPNPEAPWLSWGVYLWADGLNPRGDGLTWECDDFQEDGTHPSETGEAKVSGALLDFFTTDVTTRPWFLESGTTGADPDDVTLPQEYSLSNYPNPFNPQTMIRFTLPAVSHVRLSVLDVTGQVVAELLNGQYSAGIHEFPFDASGLGAGVYFSRLKVANATVSTKMLLLK